MAFQTAVAKDSSMVDSKVDSKVVTTAVLTAAKRGSLLVV